MTRRRCGSPAAEKVTGASSVYRLAAALARGRPLVMGVLNVTPDSFSDGGRFLAAGSALNHAGRLIAEGADIIDVGAESTRPYGGTLPVSAETEWRRLESVLPALIELGVPVSIDTMKAAIAANALVLGAAMVNDVWGLQGDPEMARTVAEHGAYLIIMHNRQKVEPSIDILADIESFFGRSLALADRAGVARERIVLDPGIGFGKSAEQSLAVLARLDRLAGFGLPLAIGVSRKRFIASISPSEPGQRLGGSIGGAVLGALAGAAIVRVHDVAETVQALGVACAIRDRR